MASFGTQLSFFLLLLLVLSPQIQGREGKVFSLFTHFRNTYNLKDPQVSLKKAKTESPTPAPAPAPTPTTAPTPTSAPAPESIVASGPAPESIIASGPAPEPDFVDRGDGYGLYGSGSSQFSPTKETPTTTTFENELLNEDLTGRSYKTGYPKTNFYSSYNGNPSNYNNEVYRNNYNNEEYRSNYNGNGYTKNYANSYPNNYNDRFYNNYNGNEHNNNNYHYNSNGFEKKREGMSDTRFLDNGKYYYHVKNENENYNLNGYELGSGSTENEGYYEKNQYPNEFDTMEEYEKHQDRHGYTP